MDTSPVFVLKSSITDGATQTIGTKPFSIVSAKNLSNGKPGMRRKIA